MQSFWSYLFSYCLLFWVRAFSVHANIGTKGWTISERDDFGTHEINFGTCEFWNTTSVHNYYNFSYHIHPWVRGYWRRRADVKGVTPLPCLGVLVVREKISDVSPWPWPSSLRPKSKSLALALALTPQVLGLGLGLVA